MPYPPSSIPVPESDSVGPVLSVLPCPQLHHSPTSTSSFSPMSQPMCHLVHQEMDPTLALHPITSNISASTTSTPPRSFLNSSLPTTSSSSFLFTFTNSLNYMSSLYHMSRCNPLLPIPTLAPVSTIKSKLSHFSSANRSMQKPPPSHHLLYLGTKTPYPAPTSRLTVLHKSSSSSNPGPRLIHVSLLARHGTRNPTNNSLERMTALETWLNSALHPRPQWLNAWSQALNKYRKDPGALTVEGEAELQGIGSRFSQLYAEALHAVGGTVRFRSSYKPRAISSAHSFLDGYLHACTKFNLPQPITFLNSQHASNFSEVDASESEQSLDLDSSQSSGTLPDLSNISLDSSSMFSIEGDPLEILPYGRDAVLRYFETNKVYSKFAVNHKAKTQKDFSKGTFGPYSAEMANRMSGSFGASSSMDVDLVRAVAEACAFDYSHGREHMSMFCRVLTPEDTRVLELFEKRHRPFFKGHESFRTVAAPLVADLAASLRASASGSASAHAADLRFAHAETLVPLLLLFGIRNNGLNSNNPEFLHGLNAMSPFAGNLAFELYECGGPKKKSHFVRFRLHERYVESIPVLGKRGKTGVVKLDHLLEFFDKVVEEEGMLNASGLDP